MTALSSMRWVYRKRNSRSVKSAISPPTAIILLSGVVVQYDAGLVLRLRRPRRRCVPCGHEDMVGPTNPNLTHTASTLRSPSNVPVETNAIDPVLTVIERANGEHQGAFDPFAGSAASCRTIRSPVGDWNIRRGPGDWQFHAMGDFTIQVQGTGSKDHESICS